MTAIYAHRGNVAGPRGTSPAGENTLKAFGAARKAGADGVELDVRLTADGLPVIQHDRRVPDGRDVANVPRASLPPEVPTLDQALEACAGLAVNVEVKHDEGDRRAAVAVAGVLGRTPPPTVLVSSFDEETLAVVHRLQPSVPLGLLIDWRTDPKAGLGRALALGCATLHPFVTQVDARLASAAAAAGIGLHVWTVNADADLAAMGDLGVAAVITDRVTAAMGILRQPRRNGGGVPG